MKNKKTVFLTEAAVIAALYTALVFIFQPLASGVIQVRVAEALTVLPFFTPAAIPGVTIGCLISNTLSGAVLPDIIFGSLATLAGAVCSYLLRKHKYLVVIPPIVANMVVVPWILRYAYGMKDAIPYMMLTVGIGEIISCGIFGIILLFALEKHKKVIFKSQE